MDEDEWLVQYHILERSLVASGRREAEAIVCVYLGRNSKSFVGHGKDLVLRFPVGALTRQMALSKENTLCK